MGSNGQEPVIIHLQHPIGSGPNPINAIRLNKLKAKHLWKTRLSEDMELGEVLAIAARMSDHPIAILEELEGEDVISVVNATADFLAACLGTGKT